MAKSNAVPGLKSTRQALLKNCKQIVNLRQEAERTFSVGYVVTEFAQTGNMPPINDTHIPTVETSSQSSHPKEFTNRYHEYIHSILVQEWIIFLDNVFEKVIDFFLKRGRFERIPTDFRIELKELDGRKLISLREGICNTSTESFSFQPYKKKIEILRKMFNKEFEQEIQKQMQMHITIRNVIQHNRGKIRENDLKEAGVAKFKLLNNREKDRHLGVNEKLTLSDKDIEGLYSIIENFSKNFKDIS